MQTRKIKSILLVLLFIGSCAKGGGGNNSIADRNAQINIDAFAAKSGLKDVECDAEGTELSGVYSFKFTDTKLSCPNMKNTQMAPTSANYTCTQKDMDFSCVNQQVAKDIFSGCINKEGKFKMALTSDPANKSATADSKVFLVGTLGKADGRIQYTMPKQGIQGPVNCISNGHVEVIQISQ